MASTMVEYDANPKCRDINFGLAAQALIAGDPKLAALADRFRTMKTLGTISNGAHGGHPLKDLLIELVIEVYKDNDPPVIKHKPKLKGTWKLTHLKLTKAESELALPTVSPEDRKWAAELLPACESPPTNAESLVPASDDASGAPPAADDASDAAAYLYDDYLDLVGFFAVSFADKMGSEQLRDNWKCEMNKMHREITGEACIGSIFEIIPSRGFFSDGTEAGEAACTEEDTDEQLENAGNRCIYAIWNAITGFVIDPFYKEPFFEAARSVDRGSDLLFLIAHTQALCVLVIDCLVNPVHNILAPTEDEADGEAGAKRVRRYVDQMIRLEHDLHRLSPKRAFDKIKKMACKRDADFDALYADVKCREQELWVPTVRAVAGLINKFRQYLPSHLEVSLSQSRPDSISEVISIILRSPHKNT